MSKKTPLLLAASVLKHGQKVPVLFENKLIRYIFIGGSAYVIEMLTLYLLKNGIGLTALQSVAISFWVGFIIAFVLQKIITFKNYDRDVSSVTKQLLGYSVLVAFNYAFSLIMVSALDAMLSVFIIRTITIAIITLWNFFVYSKLFGQKSDA